MLTISCYCARLGTNGMKVFLSVLEKHCVLLDLCSNVNKTVCMVFILRTSLK